jgi:hypothetical protein
MIKRGVFENDLIAGMQQELRKQASGETLDLAKAGECLHAALEILEEAGLQTRADQVLNVLTKIAVESSKHVKKMPTLHMLMQHGLTPEDMKAFGRGEKGAVAKMNAVLRKLGLGDEEIAALVGAHNVVPAQEADTYQKFMGWMENPTQIDEGPVQPGQTLDIKSLAAKRKSKHSDPSVPHNGHTKNLTPQKMIENLMHHGTVFNMAADQGGIDISNANFDPEMAEALGVNNTDDLQVDDIFDADITNADDDLAVSDPVPLEDFEDEVSSPKQS